MGGMAMTHAWVHMTRGIQRFGNPMRYATFLDESLNLHAAVAAACAHRAQWEVRVFDRLGLVGDVATGQASFFWCWRRAGLNPTQKGTQKERMWTTYNWQWFQSWLA